jgi:hypothetical protein
VLIGATELLPALKDRAGSSGETIAFSNVEAVKALETVTKRRPNVIALERLFAATPRGAALIQRIKSDPRLAGVEIRVLAHDSDYSRVVPRAVKPAAEALDQRGTRRAPRFKIAAKVDILVDGSRASLVDLSTVGAQAVSPASLKPNQSVRLSLGTNGGQLQFAGVVAWTSFEIPPNSGPRYRVGIAFTDADAAAVDTFISRYKA